MRQIFHCVCVYLALLIPATAQYTIGTIAGGVSADGKAGTSRFITSPHITLDPSGNLYFVSSDEARVYKLNTNGTLTLIAGNGSRGFSGDNGPATAASFNSPDALAVDAAGNVYISDTFNYRVRKVSNGIITTIAGGGTSSGDNGPATSAGFTYVKGLALDSSSSLYILDYYSVRKVTNGVITTVAGNSQLGFGFSGDNGPAVNAQLNFPKGIALDSTGNLYIADSGNGRIRKVSAGIITTVAGALLSLDAIAVDSSGANLYIADTVSSQIRKVTGGNITTVAGTGIPGFNGDGLAPSSTQFSSPQSVAVDGSGTLYVGDDGNNRVRKVSSNLVTTVIGGGSSGDGGPAASAGLIQPSGVTLDASGNIYIAEGLTNRIRKIANGVISTIAGNGTPGYSGDNGPATSATLSFPGAVVVDNSGNLYISDVGNNVIRKVTNGVITTVAGNGAQGFSGDNGPATSAQLHGAVAGAVDSSGNLYIVDTYNNRIRKVTNGIITTIAGGGDMLFNNFNDDGPATSAVLYNPQAISLDSSGNLYIADTSHGRIRKVAGGIITTVAGSGTVLGDSRIPLGDGGIATSASLLGPGGVILDSFGDVFISDTGHVRIREVSAGIITTIAGNGSAGYSGDGGPAATAQINFPSQLAQDSSGRIYIADMYNNAIRVLTPVPANPPPNCTYTVTPIGSPVYSALNASLSFGVAGGDALFSVSTAAGCSWNAVTSASFITLTGSGAVSGSRQAGYFVSRNTTTTSARSGTIVIAGQTFSITQPGTDMLTCQAPNGNPTIARGEGLAELAGEPLFQCTLLPPGGIKADVQAFFNTNVTSRLLSSLNNSSEATLLINDPNSPVLGTNAFAGVVASANSILFSQVPMPVTNSPQQLLLRVVNARLNDSLLGLSSTFYPTQVFGFLTLTTGSGAATTTTSQTISYLQTGFVKSHGSPVPGPDASTQAGFPLAFREGFSSSFRARVATCTFGVSCPQDPSLPGIPYYSESEFLNSSALGPVVGRADTGTRMLARFTNIPSGLRMFASIFRSSANQPGCAVPGILAQLVSADNNGAGGTFISPVNQEAYHEIALVNGAGSATWEITDADQSCINTLNTFVYFQGVSQPPSPAQLSQIGVTLNLAPLSAVATPSSTAPLPRFLDVDTSQPPPPCPSCVSLTLSTNPQGLKVMADSVGYSQTTVLRVVPGLTHMLSVDPNSQALNGQRYQFTGWSNGVNTPAQNLAVNGPATITANFAATGLGIVMTHTGDFAPGQAGAVYTVTVSNSPTGPVTAGLVTVTEILPAGLSLTAMSGSGWNCSGVTCTRSDVLSPGSSYPVITVKVNVSATATSPQMNQVSVSGGGSLTVSFTDPTNVGLVLLLSRNVLNFGFNNNSGATSPQPVAVNFVGGAGLNWTATSNRSSIIVSPASGIGNGVFQVSVASTGDFGQSGTITVNAPGTANPPQTIQVGVTFFATNAPPFGSFDTPVNNTTGVVGAIPITGWALDNVEITGVDIWREPITGEPANNLIPVGNAVFVADARPDVQALFPTHPFSYRAGWGYQMLTNFLPNSTGSGASGNGTYKIHAIVHNKAGAQLDLGTKTIVVDNSHAAKPFGTLDTPAQGGTVSGNDYVNFGWALTPQPGVIPKDGSTITLVLDGAPVGHPTYDQFRPDIASLFPGYANSAGAVGFYHIDATSLANGVHTISWNVFDNLGRGEGLGSRYFNVSNNSSGVAVPEDVINESVSNVNNQPGPIEQDSDGGYSLTMEEVGRIELHLGAASGNMLVLDEAHALPIGSTLKGGVFYWQPGPGFLGEYKLRFERRDGTKIPVRVTIVPKRFP